MNILFLANSLSGLYSFRKELIKRLLDEGHTVTVSGPHGKKEELIRSLGCEIIYTNIDRRGINPLTDFKLMIDYLKLVCKIKPDKVITYTIKPNVYGGMICRFKRIPLYANVTGLGTAFQKQNWLSSFVSILYKLGFKKAKTVFFENAENRKIFIDNKILSSERTYLLNGAGVNLDEFAFSSYPEDGTIHFLFMGRMMDEKGIRETLNSIKKLRDNGYDAVLDILGTYEENYSQTVDELQRQGYINYYGYQENVKPFIENAHCSVLPSYHEGMSNTLLESASMGRPLITTNIHGCKEAVIDGKNGYLCEKKNADDLYEKMKMFVELPYEDKVKMGKHSRAHMEEVFDKRKVVEKTISKIFE